jgi:glycosyltransferase involved in cell wall biosynthesis
MIFFLGPLPPPVHGFSAINQKMLNLLSEKSEVRVFNTSPGTQSRRSPLGKAFKLLDRVRQFLTFLLLALVRRPDAFYAGLSGGMGQVFDTFYIVAARLSGASIFLHHHSFVYVNEPKPYNRICLWLAGDACHIALCDTMAEKLSGVYGIAPERICILSNAAYLDDRKETLPVQKAPRETLTLGFISNIILEKGIAEFFDVVANLTQQGYRVKGRVAGPVDAGIQDVFSAMMEGQNEIEYVGPVYDDKKDAFYRSIDILLFPTKYRNEAEPLTILEAMRERIPVIAANRGCIRSMIARSGMGCPDIDHYVEDASESIKAILNGTISLQSLSDSAYRQFCKMRSVHQARLDDLLEKIAAGKQLHKPVRA